MPEPYEPQEREPTPKKTNYVKWGIIIIAVLAILAIILYFVFVTKSPNDTAIPTEKKGITTTGYIIIGVVLIGVTALVMYLIFRKKTTDLNLKVPVPPDRAIALFVENFSLRHEIQCAIEEQNGKPTYVPMNKHAVIIHDRLPFFHTATGDNFLLIEIEINEGNMQGLHTIVIPIDRGEDTIKNGYYRIDTHTPRFQFRLNRQTYPMSSMVDKQDRFKLAILENPDADQQAAQSMMQQQRQDPYAQSNPYVTTPLDQMEGQPEPGTRMPTIRPRRRYTRYGRR